MATGAFRTEVTPIPDMPEAGTLHLMGRVTYEVASDLRESLLSEMSRLSARTLVLQLSDIEEMDTAGAAVLAEALKLGQSRGMRVLLCSPSEAVLRIFRLAGFEEVLDRCCADPQETLRRLQE